MLSSAPLMVGIDPASDITALLNLGVRQFFAGYVPERWLTLYGAQLSPNRRYRIKEQFTNLSALAECIKQIHHAGGVFNLTLNSPWANNLLMPELLQLVEQAQQLQVDGIVVGSMALLEQLRGRKLSCNLILSNLLGVYSLPAAQFLANRYQPDKIVLPRDLLLSEIRAICTAMPDMQFEVFLFGDHCRLSESHCFVEHGYDSVVNQDLCGYAQQKRQHHRRARPDFKSRLLANTSAEPEALQALAGSSLALPDLLDQLDKAIYEQDENQQARLLTRIRVQDTRHSVSQNLMRAYRAINLLAKLNTAEAAELKQRFEQHMQNPAPAPEQAYFKLNPAGIKSALNVFAEFGNISSYKVPMRGRRLLDVLQSLENDPGQQHDFRAQLYETNQ